MTAQDDKAILLSRQFQEQVVVLDIEVEMLPCIHGKAVEDDLSELTVVEINVTERLQRTIAHPQTKEMIHGDIDAVCICLKVYGSVRW